MLSSAPRSSSDLDFFSPSRSNKPGASPISTVTVTTRLTRRPFLSQPQSRSSTASSLSARSSPCSDPPCNFSRKRKLYPEASLVSVPSSELPPAVKRLRSATPKQKPRRNSSTSKNSSRDSSRRLSSPEPIYRSDRSRSTSLFRSNDSVAGLSSRQWVTDELGTPGENHLSSETVVKQLMKSYRAYFTNPDDPNDMSFEPHSYPMVELEYPNHGALERFILLAPKDKDHYNPIMDLERTLYTIVECYLTKEQKALFGPIPNFSLSEALSPPPSPSPSPSPPCSNASHTSTSSLSSISSSDSSLTCLSSIHSSPPIDRLPVLRAVQRAIHLQHGPLFLKAMQRVNTLLRSIKYPSIQQDSINAHLPNPLLDVVRSWTYHPLPEKVLMRIIEENYQRTVGPNIRSLRRYEAFSSTVYGELLPSFVQEIVQTTGLNQDSLFLDLGSGVANVVVQASLQSGCKSYGIELMPHPARVAKDVVEQIRIRCRMWGVKIGEMELEEGDMLHSRRLDELIAKADVVLVDNKVFDESLNEALRPKFLDLKEGAYVISLQPFVSTVNARVTRRNVDDISAIFDVEERPYHPGSVSWGNSGGFYYLHKVDRQGYAKIKDRFESLHGNSTRSTRSRR